jgi:hypothetical protein
MLLEDHETLLASEQAVLEQRLNDLLNEEGIPIAPLDDEHLQRLKRWIRAYHGADQLFGVRFPEELQPKLGVMRLARPAVAVLRTIVDEKQDPTIGRTLGKQVESGQALAVSPVEVLKDHHEWLAPAFRQEELRDGLYRVSAPGLGISFFRVGIGDTDQRKQTPQNVFEPPVERKHFSDRLLAPGALGVVQSDPKVFLQEIDERQIGRSVTVGE